MAFPTTPITLLVELALGADVTAAPGTWSWTTVSSTFAYERDRIHIERGRHDYGTVADPWTLSMTVDNRDGRWSTRNPNGAWFGTLKKGTPIRVSAEGHIRFAGFISALPPRWDVSGKDRYALLEAKGLLYRLLGPAAPARSAAYRSYTKAAPWLYWSFEADSSSVTPVSSIRSASTGGSDLTVNSPGLILGTETGPAGSKSLPMRTSSVVYDVGAVFSSPSEFVGNLDDRGATTSWSVSMAVRLTRPPSWAGILSFALLYMNMKNGGNFYLVANSAGTSALGSDVFFIPTNGFTPDSHVDIDIYDGLWHEVYADVVEAAGVSTFRTYVDGLLVNQGHKSVVDAYPLRFGGPEGLLTTSGADSVDNTGATVAFGQLRFDAPLVGPLVSIVNGYVGEEAHTRFLRLSTEDGVVASAVTGGTGDSQFMGAQQVNSYLDLIRECEATDQAFIYEDTAFGLVFQALKARINMTAAVALTYTTAGHVAPPLEPTDDDRDLVNDVEVRRDGGLFSRRTLDSGAELAINSVGRRAESVSYSLATDDLTGPLADWRLFVGTFPGYRVPLLSMDLAAAPSLISSVTTADIAYRLTIASPPVDVFIDTVDLMVEGYSETLGTKGWDIQANCSLYRPYLIATVESAIEDRKWRIDHSASTLASNLTSGALSASVASTGSLWTTLAGDFPFWINITGEKIKVTNITGSSSPQTFTIVRSENGIVKAHSTSDPVSLWQPAVIGL